MGHCVRMHTTQHIQVSNQIKQAPQLANRDFLRSFNCRAVISSAPVWIHPQTLL